MHGRPEATAGPPVPHQLPAHNLRFVGRSAELAELSGLLDQATTEGATGKSAGTAVIAVISGMGGIGKSTLALHWARQHLDEFPDGQLWVNLRGFDRAGEPVPATVALRGFLDALGVPGSAVPVDLAAQEVLYRSLVAGKRMLVVLDNARDTAQAIPLLPGSAGCTVLITSRRKLTGLVTTHGARPVDLGTLTDREARDLLSRYLSTRRLAEEPVAAAILLARCAGLPLALSIVAARASANPHFPLEVLARELQEATTRLDTLDTGDIDASMEAVLSWSYQALSPEASMVFSLLGLAPGPDISLAAAVSLTALPLARARTVLRELTTSSLLLEFVPGRFRMHDLIRLYAASRASHDLSAEARTAALRRVIDFYLHTAHAGDRLMVPARQWIRLIPAADGCVPAQPADLTAARTWFDAEHGCLLAAQDLAVAEGWHTHTWQLAWALNSYHNFRGQLSDQLATWQAAAGATALLSDLSIRALADRTLGHAYARAGRYADALRHLHKAVSEAETAGDINEQAHSHRTLARAWALQRDYGRALDHANRALSLLSAIGNDLWLAELLNEAGSCHAHLGDLVQARASCDEAIQLQRLYGDREGQGYTLGNLGYIARRSGRHAEAIGYYRQAIATWQELGHAYNQANYLDSLAEAHLGVGEDDEARRAWQEALQLYEAQHRTADAARIRRQLDSISAPAPVRTELDS